MDFQETTHFTFLDKLAKTYNMCHRKVGLLGYVGSVGFHCIDF